MKLAREALEAVLKAHEPHPALAIDRHWNLVSANSMVTPLLGGVAPKLLQGKINVMRLGLHPEGLAARTVNLHEWRGHLLDRLHRQCEATADAELIALRDELRAYPVPARAGPPPKIAESVVVPFQLRFGSDVLSFISTTMVFGTPVDITLSELALEAFYPADEMTAQKLREVAGAAQ
jgi:hypothetical protein